MCNALRYNPRRSQQKRKGTMPATLELPRVVRAESVRSSPSEDWLGLLRSINPIAEWETRFAEWRKDIQEFRETEQQCFFSQIENTLLQHVHRGWLCSLISQGEMLAVELINELPKATDQLKFLNLCLENLTSSLETWHMNEDDLVSVAR